MNRWFVRLRVGWMCVQNKMFLLISVFCSCCSSLCSDWGSQSSKCLWTWARLTSAELQVSGLRFRRASGSQHRICWGRFPTEQQLWSSKQRPGITTPSDTSELNSVKHPRARYQIWGISEWRRSDSVNQISGSFCGFLFQEQTANKRQIGLIHTDGGRCCGFTEHFSKGERAFSVVGHKLRNSFPLTIRSSPSTDIFKTHIHNSLSSPASSWSHIYSYQSNDQHRIQETRERRNLENQ